MVIFKVVLIVFACVAYMVVMVLNLLVIVVLNNFLHVKYYMMTLLRVGLSCTT